MINRILAFLFLLTIATSCHVGRFFVYNFADVKDYKKFPVKNITRTVAPFYFPTAQPGKKAILPSEVKRNRKTLSFGETLKKSGSYAFMIIRNDTILYEWYKDGFKESDIHPSFSMAKSFMSLMIGIAIKEGHIKSTSEPITNYIDHLDKTKFSPITIQHLLDMQSGIKFNENYFNPFGDIAKYYYGRNLKKYLRQLKIEEEPGKRFRYISLNSQLLALILEKATGMPPADYLQEKVWNQLGMEHDASWNVDSKKNKTEKAFCCINSRVKDFAKLGKLYLNKGNWNGKEIVPATWVDESVNFKTDKNNFLYSNQWWHTRTISALKDTSTLKAPFHINYPKKESVAPFVYSPSGDFFAQGFLGQYVYVSPKNNVIIVRLGKKEGGLVWPILMRDIASKN